MGFNQTVMLSLAPLLKSTRMTMVVTSVERTIPFRCAVTAEVQSLDTAPVGDDAVNPATNESRLEIEVVDRGDLR